jgi:hypothetical protein
MKFEIQFLNPCTVANAAVYKVSVTVTKFSLLLWPDNFKYKEKSKKIDCNKQ